MTQMLLIIKVTRPSGEIGQVAEKHKWFNVFLYQTKNLSKGPFEQDEAVWVCKFVFKK